MRRNTSAPWQLRATSALSLPPSQAPDGADPLGDYRGLTLRWVTGRADTYPSLAALQSAEGAAFGAALAAVREGEMLALELWVIAYVDAPNHNGVRYRPGSASEVAAMTPPELPLLPGHDRSSEVGIASDWTVVAGAVDGADAILARVSVRAAPTQDAMLRGMARSFSAGLGVAGEVVDTLGRTYPDLMAALGALGGTIPPPPFEIFLSPAPLDELSVVTIGAAPGARAITPTLARPAAQPTTPPRTKKMDDEEVKKVEEMEDEEEPAPEDEAAIEEDLRALVKALQAEVRDLKASSAAARAQLKAADDVAFEAAWSSAVQRCAVTPADRKRVDTIRQRCGTDFVVADLAARPSALATAPRGHAGGGDGAPPAPAPGSEPWALAKRMAEANPHRVPAYNRLASQRGWEKIPTA